MADLQDTHGPRPEARRVSKGRRVLSAYARAVTWAAPAVVLLWIGGTVAALILVPPLSTKGGGLSSELSAGSSKPISTQIRAVETFGLPLLAQNVVVQHDRAGLPLAARVDAVRAAVDLDTRHPAALKNIAAAVPVTNDLRLFPSSRQQGTTALTYLFYRPGISPQDTAKLSRAYADHYLSAPGDRLVGVTGAFPAEAAQGSAISSSLDMVEYITVGVLVLIVGITFRSVVTPLLTIFTAGMTYLLSQRFLSLATIHLGITVPAELDPIIVVLLLGMVTDYSVFYASSMRRRLHAGEETRSAVRRATEEVSPLVGAAGLTVGIGVSLILAARLSLFSSLAPGLAISVGVAVVVVLTFVPGALALLRSLALWPSARSGLPRPRLRQRIQDGLAHPLIAVPALVVTAGALVALTVPLHSLDVGVNLISDLPASNPAAVAARAAAAGFTPGVVEPAEITVTGPTVADRTDLDRLQSRLAGFPGVAGVLGPGNVPSFVPVNIFHTSSGNAARYLVVLDQPPFGAAALHELAGVDTALPGMLHRSGLPGWRPAAAGDTAISRSVIKPSRSDLLRVGILIVAVDLLVAMIFLRSVLGPLLMTLSSALVVAAALGVTRLVFPSAGPPDGLTFYVPFACEVLLLSFGADYNMFVAGEIWREAARRPFRLAVSRGGTVAARAINIAGFTLAASFGVLAVVPLRSFREIAVCMGVGLLLDTFVVRFLLVPAALSVMGPRALWPGRFRARPSRRPRPTRRSPTSTPNREEHQQ